MTMRASLERNAAIGVPDEYGNPSPASWTALTTVPAWLWTTADREVMDARKTAVVEDTRMIVPRGTDVTAKDRVNGVKDRRGRDVRPGIFMIESVINRRDHLELMLIGIEP